jgi:hypothetical protein
MDVCPGGRCLIRERKRPPCEVAQPSTVAKDLNSTIHDLNGDRASLDWSYDVSRATGRRRGQSPGEEPR